MFYETFIELCETHQVKANTVTKDIGLSSATATKWKNSGEYPKVENLLKLADYFNCSMNYLIYGEDQEKQHGGYQMPLHQYRWDFPEKSEDDALYNRVCRSMYAIHGKHKAAALLSALRLPADKPCEIGQDQLSWLARRSNTHTLFFSEPDLMAASRSEIIEKARNYEAYSDAVAESDMDPEWDNNFSYLLYNSIAQTTKTEYLIEIEVAFEAAADEQPLLMKYIRDGIAKYNADKAEREEKENDIFDALSAEMQENA